MANSHVSTAMQFEDLEQEHDTAQLGMWTFLATEVLFFGVLFIAYTISRLLHPQGFAEACEETDLWSGGIETFVLITSSMTMAFAVRAAKLGWHLWAFRLIIVTIALGTAFLTIHIMGYISHYHEGLVPGAYFTYKSPYASQVELFFFLYYVMTGFHLLHLSVGLIVLTVMAVMAWRRSFSPEYYTPIEITALYWDFVDIVWVFLFTSFYLVSRA
jgi:cytochrome c oxidase subunit III